MHHGAARAPGSHFTYLNVHAGTHSSRFDSRLPLDAIGIHRREVKSTIWNSYLQIFQQDIYDNLMSRFQSCKVF